MNRKGLLLGVLVFVLFASTWSMAQSVPEKINYQGRMMEGGQPFDGPGLFKFAICDETGTTTYWSNDSSSVNCMEPMNAVNITVDKGIYHLGLGDTNIPGMDPLPPPVFQTNNLYLSVWFGATVLTIEHLTPMQPITSVPYAMQAENARTLDGLTPGELGGREPNVIVVAPSGGDTTTIAGGLLMADTISPALVKVAPGVYLESDLVIPEDVTVQCIQPRMCIVDAMSGPGFVIMGHDNIRIQGFQIRNTWEGVRLDGGNDNIEITDNLFTNCDRGVNMMGGSTVSGIYIRHNVFQVESEGMVSYGVRFMKSHHVWIEDNIFNGFRNGEGRAVWVENGSCVRVRNNLFSNIEGMGGSISSAVGLIDCDTVWVENNAMSDIRGSPLAAIYCEDCESAHIRNNEIRGINLMGGGTTDGIYALRGRGIQIEGNNIFHLHPQESTGIRLRDVGDYRIVDNRINSVGDPWGSGGNAWGIRYECRSGAMPGPWANKQVIMDNLIAQCDNGLSLDYSLMQEWEPYADKVIKGNIILDGDTQSGVGIKLFDATHVQVIENKVMIFEFGLDIQNMGVNPNPIHVMRNELWQNDFADLNIMASAGIIRVFYNFMDVFNRPGPGPAVYEGFNINSTGGTP